MTFTKALRGTGWTLIVIGAIVLEFAAYEVFGTALIEKGHQTDLRKEFVALADNPVAGSTAEPLERPTSGRAIADLRIPSIDVDVIVVEGVKLGDLVFGPGRYPSSAKFGEKGSTAIAGHRTGWGSPFLNVDKLKPGDTIIVTTTNRTVYTYVVTRSIIVGPDEGKVIRGNPDSPAASQLTLTTCTPKYTSSRRLIIWADLDPKAGGTA